jgi:hypothetical protein
LLPSTARTRSRVQVLWFLSPSQRLAFVPCFGKVYPRSAALSGSRPSHPQSATPEAIRLARILLSSTNSASIATVAFHLRVGCLASSHPRLSLRSFDPCSLRSIGRGLHPLKYQIRFG